MSTAWNYFNNYKIIERNGYPYIQYMDGYYFDFSASSALLMQCPLFKMGLELPVYEKSEPPKSGKLKLIEPSILVAKCEEIICLFQADDNNLTDEKRLLKKELIKSVKDNVEDAIDLLCDLKEWSENGYFVTIDRE